jgi:chemotaxis protein CheD
MPVAEQARSAAEALVRGSGVYLQPGQLVATAEAVHITTILGSCVAVCLHDAAMGASGMNHYLLPRGPRGADSARFAEVALPRLLERVLAQGASRPCLEAKVFGGARILAASTVPRDLGQENVDAALTFLATERIRVTALNTGGTRGRKLIFQTVDGVVWVKTF